MARYQGSCHCGDVRFEIESDLDVVTACNCSICTKKGFVHLIVQKERFVLKTPEENLATYTFGTHTAKHHFCRRCGIAPYYRPRSHPDDYDVNVRCLEGVELSTLRVQSFDGRRWEDNIASFRAQVPGEHRGL